MFIKVDIRETDLLQQINQLILNIPLFKNIKVVTETLPIGDIIISNDVDELIIIERKTIADLLASIKDGRYEEQSYRLNGLNHPNHNIIYLVEGDVNRVNRFKDNKTEKLTSYSAMFSLNYYKGFSVFRSFSLEESATIICNMAYKLEKENTNSGKKPYYQNRNKNNNENTKIIELKNENTGVKEENTELKEVKDEIDQTGGNIKIIEIINNEENEQNDKDYVNVVKKVKKENVTPDNIGEIMLCQIPGISSVTAIAIMDKFKTLSNLIKEVEQNVDCLKDISYTNSKGQSRKINKTSGTNIAKYLLKK